MAFRRFDPVVVARRIQPALDEAARGRGGVATLAIPGGRSPGPVLTALARELSDSTRSRLALLWVDERAVPKDAPERNDATTLAAWKAGGALPGKVLPMPADAEDLDAAALAYARSLKEVTRWKGTLDVCLLGIGEDGHMASLFPNHPGLSDKRPVFAVTNSPKPPPRRLTLSLSVIAAADLRIVLALGEEKWSVARRAIERPGDPGIPVSLLPRANTVFYLDDPSL